MSQFSHLVDLLQHRAIAQPNDIAYKFLSNGTTETGSLTYQELDRRAKAIASRLQSLVKPGARALLVYPYHEGLEFIAAFMGCLYAKVIAVTKSTPRRGKAIAELTERVKLSGATILLTTQEFLDIVETEVAKNSKIPGKLKFFPRLATDRVDLSLENDWQRGKIEPDTIAFLQYTSGSTGTPKGVIVTHQNILHNEETIRQGFNHDESAIVVGWLPMFHDMGLIGNILQPLYLGTPSILMSPVSLSQQPFEWLKAISHYRATTSGGPNFAYDLLCLKATPEKLAGLDLSNWKVAFSGAETVRGETIDRFSHIFANCGFNRAAFYPCYGMAEATLFITGGLQDEEPIIKYVDSAALEKNQVRETSSEKTGSKAIVGCGRQWLDTEVMIVNPETLTPCQPHEVGEIWVLGSGIGQGYWEQKQETKDTFQGLLKGTKAPEYLR
ncbi:MAG: fatty acyl-AMP ligase, partial [Xenococcus sp. (in: cyanobacteria)]